jgi:hypothetical protein
MLDNEDAENVPETEEKELTPGSQEIIIIELLPDGTFNVDHEHVPDITTALKHVLAIVNERQSSTTAQSGFESGFSQH